MSHHVVVSLPDGRAVRVDWRAEIVPVLRRINVQLERPIGRRDHAQLGRDDLAAAAWLDAHPELCCTAAQMRDGTCTAHD